MITTPVESEVFDLFVKHGVSDAGLFNNMVKLISKHIKDERGNSDSEFYDTLTLLSNSENNAGWNDNERHSKRIEVIDQSMQHIIDRSGEYLS